MVIFCFLWTPLFYLLWRAVTRNDAYAGGLLALLAGSIFTFVQFFLGSFIEPGGFGLSRWVSGFVDIVGVPALLPFVVYLVLVIFRLFSGTVSFANFALLWFIPAAAIRALGWIFSGDPILLVLVPVLWSTIAVGVSFFITLIQTGRIPVIIAASLGILVVPFAAASSYWAFFGHKTTMGYLFLFAAAVPMLVSMILALIRIER
ncbi:MAG: hypothetical protein LBQ94_00785 [Treponema sp.]|jgi:hypothetical protein|nr:hypothetical protein [Treponema sp.]